MAGEYHWAAWETPAWVGGGGTISYSTEGDVEELYGPFGLEEDWVWEKEV